MALSTGSHPEAVGRRFTARYDHTEPATDTLTDDVEQLLADVRELGRVRLETLREQAHDATAKSLRMAWMGVGALALTISAVVLVARGIAGGLGALLSNTAWAGDLVGGALLLAALTGAYVAIEKRREHRRVEELSKSLRAGREAT